MRAIKQNQIQNDTIASWKSLETFSNKLDVQFINNENSLIFKELHDVPPRSKYSFQIFKGYTISCIKGFTQIKYTHLVNSSCQVTDIIERLRTVNCNIKDKLNNTAENLQTIIKSENMNPEEVKNLPFLIEEMTHKHAYVLTFVPKKSK